MKQIDIQVSLTEFVNFINSSGMKKMTIVANAKAKHEEQTGSPYDYWKDFKDKVKRLLKRQGTRDDLYKVVEEVRDEMRENYNQMIAGYLKFWKPTRMAWLTPAKKMIRIGGVKMMLNPEIGIRWQDKDYMIKLYLKANETLDKRHADIILALMESELREKVDEDVEFGILDVKRGKLFLHVDNDPRLLILLKSEGLEFAEMRRQL